MNLIPPEELQKEYEKYDLIYKCKCEQKSLIRFKDIAPEEGGSIYFCASCGKRVTKQLKDNNDNNIK